MSPDIGMEGEGEVVAVGVGVVITAVFVFEFVPQAAPAPTTRAKRPKSVKSVKRFVFIFSSPD